MIKTDQRATDYRTALDRRRTDRINLTHDRWPSISCNVCSWPTHVQKFKVNGQLVPKTVQKDGQTEATALPAASVHLATKPISLYNCLYEINLVVQANNYRLNTLKHEAICSLISVTGLTLSCLQSRKNCPRSRKDRPQAWPMTLTFSPLRAMAITILARISSRSTVSWIQR